MTRNLITLLMLCLCTAVSGADARVLPTGNAKMSVAESVPFVAYGVASRPDSVQDAAIEQARMDSLQAVADSLTNLRRKFAASFGVPLDSVAPVLGEGTLYEDLFGAYNPKEIPQRGQDPVRSQKWWRRFFVGAFTGADGFIHTREKHYGVAAPIGGFVGYQINRLNAVRLSGSLSMYREERDRTLLKHLSLEADYMLGLTNYMYGYDHNRVLDVYPLVGLGWDYTRSQGVIAKSVKGRAGINFELKLSDLTSVFAEPYLAVARDQIDLSDNPSPYDIEWGIRGGMRLDFMRHPSKWTNCFYNPNVFVDFTMGANTYMGSHLSALRSLGSNWQVNVGHWFDQIVGARIGLGCNDFYWRGTTTPGAMVDNVQVRPDVHTSHRGMSLYGMAEIMLSPLNYIPSYRYEEQPFYFNLSGGVLLGEYAKMGIPSYGNLLRTYWGWTFAAEAVARVAPGTSLFVQPRLYLTNYFVHGVGSIDGHFADKIVTLNAGVRLQREQYTTKAERTDPDFERHFSVSGQVGSHKVLGSKKTQTHTPINFNAAVRGMYHLNRMTAVGMEVKYFRSNDQARMRYRIKSGERMLTYTGWATAARSVLSIRPVFSLNLSEWWLGHTASNRWSVEGYLGPSFNVVLGTKVTLNPGELTGGEGDPRFSRVGYGRRFVLGGFGGFRLNCRVWNTLGVYLAPEGEAFLSRTIMTLKSPMPYRVPTVITSVSLGANYSF